MLLFSYKVERKVTSMYNPKWSHTDAHTDTHTHRYTDTHAHTYFKENTVSVLKFEWFVFLDLLICAG